ncbi:hypothetical protein KC19_1G317600 [Ceratodon purpureus]|uniref:Uncharacterized protein n=1 Tax=Ceratodon purpureus TaxID=3225 RepID=A0A8T0JCT2_CERPU|nr:hypothetical protein KC19_1G317600 [Ceratodon purpureus]
MTLVLVRLFISTVLTSWLVPSADAEILEHVKEYIKKKIDGMVKEACHKRVMDITTVAMAIASSSVVPFSGVAVVVAATIMQSLDFSATLGLIEQHQDVTCSEGAVKDMSSQIGNRIRDNGSSIQAGVETAVLEALKSESKSQLKSEQGQELQQWLYDEILKDILADMLCTAAMDCAWIMTPILAVPKYMMHRHLIKRMYHKLGDKARVAHCTWTEQNFVVTTVQTTVVSQVAVDANGNIQAATVKAAQEVLNGAGVQQISMTSSTYLQQQGLTSPSKRLPGQRPKRSSLFAYCFCTRGSAVDAEDKDM